MLNRLHRRLRRREEGQAALELVLTLPLFFTFFLFLIDLGIMMYGYVSIANAAREGARYGSVNCGAIDCTAAVIQQRAVDRSGNFITNLADVTVSWPEGGTRGAPVVVEIVHDHDLIFFPFDIDIRSCSVMRLEQGEPSVSASGDEC